MAAIESVEETAASFNSKTILAENKVENIDTEVTEHDLPMTNEVLISSADALKYLSSEVLSVLEKEFNGKPSEIRTIDNKDRIF